MSNKIDYFELLITWYETDDVFYTLIAYIGNQTLRLRLNDFPSEPLYTLFVDEVYVVDFDDIPKLWIRK